jgi:hypothetical protein
MSNKPKRTPRTAGKAKAAPARARKASIPPKRPVGRPSAFRPAYVEKAYKLALLGMTDAQMADFFGVGEATLNRWKLAHFEFRESIKRGKVDADSNVAESLYKAALGEGVIIEVRENSDAEGNVIGRVRETKTVPSNVAAMIFWLKNRQPGNWRERVEQQTDVTLVGPGNATLMRIFD